MTLELLKYIITPIVLLVISWGTYMYKALVKRVENLEQKDYEQISRKEANEIIDRRVKHIEDSVSKIDAKVDRIIDILIDRE